MIYKNLPRLVLAATLILMHVSGGQQSNYEYRAEASSNSGENSNYKQNSNCGQNSNYKRNSNYGQYSNYKRNSNYGQNSNYEHICKSNNFQNEYCVANYKPTSNNSYDDKKHSDRYVEYSFTQGGYCCSTSRISKLYTDYLIPDATKMAPRFIMDVTFPENNYVCLGNELTHDQTQKEPDVNYPTRPGDYYSVALIDYDASSWPPFVHWWVANVPGGDTLSGTTRFQFVGPNPPRETGWHRYTFICFRQCGKIYFDTPAIDMNDRPARFNFSMFWHVNKYGMDPQPHAMNFFMLRFDNFTKNSIE